MSSRPLNHFALSLGSNVGDRLFYLDSAVALLKSYEFKVESLSRIYETEPVECGPQRSYLNRVVMVGIQTPPRDLLKITSGIEQTLGRCRTGYHQPRTIDIDILFSGSVVIRTNDLSIPHPAIPCRKSILIPLKETAPDWVHPFFGRSVSDLLDVCTDWSSVELFNPS